MNELPNYREELEQIKAYTDKAYLTLTMIYQYTGRGRKWVHNHLELESGTTPTELARRLALLPQNKRRKT